MNITHGTSTSLSLLAHGVLVHKILDSVFKMDACFVGNKHEKNVANII